MYYVYTIENLLNGKIYIGKSKVSTRRNRWTEHIWMSKQNPKIYRFTSIDYAIKKYGSNNFEFRIIKYFSTEIEALLEENYWINYLLEAKIKIYNFNHQLGTIISTEKLLEKRKKLSERMIGKNNPFYGKKHSSETKQKFCSIRKGSQKGSKNNMFGKNHSKESKDKISKNKTGKSNPKALNNTFGAKLKEKDVLELRKLISEGNFTNSQLCERFNINKRTFYDIKNYVSWRHLKMENPIVFKFALREDLKNEKQFLPTRANKTDSGWDARAAQIDRQPIVLRPFQKILIPLGFRAYCPEGWWYELKPRSSTFAKKSLHCLYGTIDEGFENEVKIAVQFIPELKLIHDVDGNIKLDNETLNQTLTIQFGEAIGQIIPVKRQEMNIIEIDNEQYSKETDERNASRRAAGWGSSG